MLGGAACANTEEETETQAISAKHGRNFFKNLSPLEQKSRCVGAGASSALRALTSPAVRRGFISYE
jgi:hypothetical protein